VPSGRDWRENRLPVLPWQKKASGQAIQNIKTYASLCGMPWVGSVTGLAKNPGDIAQNKNVTCRLLNLADKITEIKKD